MGVHPAAHWPGGSRRRYQDDSGEEEEEVEERGQGLDHLGPDCRTFSRHL